MDAGARKGYLDGQLLIAMPTISDPRFERSVIYLCAHSSDGAMGIVVNKPAPDITFPELLTQLNVIDGENSIRLPRPIRRKQVYVGGPVETGRGFVLHTSDYFIENSTLPIDESICLTATLEILKAIASGAGPHGSLLALGYAGWGAGQLETEIQSNGWLTCPADPDLVFNTALEDKYEQALAKIGVDPAKLASIAGHA
ncbi:MAG: YqgE/AlgH family protein [Hyphomicrobiales bacterium]|jgi:putative transcriptional regulator|nr:YqgE/AlgH family protein [Hyphomicrobiales bacterium]